MKIPPISVAEISRVVQGELVGPQDTVVTGIAPIEHASRGDLIFVAQSRFVESLQTTEASAVLVDMRLQAEVELRPVLIRVANPYLAFVRVIEKCVPAYGPALGVHPSAVLGTNVRLGREVAIGPLVVIEDDCVIGDAVQIGSRSFVGKGSRIGSHTRLFPGVHVAHDVSIGNNVIIQFGAVIGSDGFGYVKHEGRYHRIPHLGTVVIEDEVEIGANCCIDRATFGETRLRKGVKLDNLIHLAHNVEIGEHTVMAAQCGVSGSTRIGKEVTVGGQVGFIGHAEIGDRSTIGAQAGVTKSISAGLIVSGYPARDHAKARREEAAIRRLPDLIKRVRTLERALGNRFSSEEVEIESQGSDGKEDS